MENDICIYLFNKKNIYCIYERKKYLTSMLFYIMLDQWDFRDWEDMILLYSNFILTQFGSIKLIKRLYIWITILKVLDKNKPKISF